MHEDLKIPAKRFLDEVQSGRYLLPEDEAPSAENVVVIGYGEWVRRFEGAADVVGRTVELGRAIGEFSREAVSADPKDLARDYPAVVRDVTGIDADTAILDGEIVVFGAPNTQNRDVNQFRPAQNMLVRTGSMNRLRWYSTATVSVPPLRADTGTSGARALGPSGSHRGTSWMTCCPLSPSFSYW